LLFCSLRSGAGLPLRRETTRFLARSKIRREKRGSRLGSERQTNETEHVDIYRQNARSVRNREDVYKRKRWDQPVRPGELGTDLVNVGVGAVHELILRFTSSFKFFGCSLHHGIRSFIAPDEVSVFLRVERHTAE